MSFSDVIRKAGRCIKSGFLDFCSGVRDVWISVRNRVKDLIGSFMDLFDTTDVSNPDECEAKRRKAASDAVRMVLGDNPLRAICDADSSERERMLAALTDRVACAIGIPAPDISVEIMKRWTAGYYNCSLDRIVVNRAEVDRFPMAVDEAAELLDTLIHEIYHAFQYNAIVRPSKNGVTKEQAAEWRKNFRNYISYDHNPRLYWIQPVEESARAFAHAVVLGC